MSPEYLAGWFDGEGCITIQKPTATNGYHVRLSIGNTHLPILKEIQEQFGGSVYPCTTVKSKRVKQFYQWQLSGNRCTLNFIDTILPYLRVKREQVALARWYLSQQKSLTIEQKEEFRLEMKNLKQENFPVAVEA